MTKTCDACWRENVEPDEDSELCPLHEMTHELLREHKEWSERLGKVSVAALQEDLGPLQDLVRDIGLTWQGTGSPRLKSPVLKRLQEEPCQSPS